jgi:hypothetical protein
LTCVKDAEFFELLDIDKYVHEFKHTDYVIISAGINDLSRYGQPASSICRFICNRLRRWTIMFPNTTFIFNSLLTTGFEWLNRRVLAVNRALFDLSLELRNSGSFYFLDTHHLLRASGLPCVISPRGNGIHVSHDAGRLVQRCIMDCVLALDRQVSSSPASAVWPLRPQFRRVLNDLHERHRRFM